MTAIARNYGSIASERRGHRIDHEANDHQNHPHHVARTTRRALVVTLIGGALLILAAGNTASTVLTHRNSPLIYAMNSNSKVPGAGIQPSTALSPPTQVHVAFAKLERIGTKTEQSLGVTVSWATKVQTSTSSVRFGVSPTNLSSIVHAGVPSEQYQFCAYTSPWFHHVEIPSSALEPSSTYYCASVAQMLVRRYIRSISRLT